jgi:hypothetical protein
MFHVVIIYPWMVRRGARPAERVVGAFLPMLFWCGKEVVRMAGFFPPGQSLFILLFPVHFNIVWLAIGQMGICEIASRAVARRRGQGGVRVLTFFPALAVALMVALLTFTNFDGGVTYFFLFNDLYRWLFLS